MIYIVKILFLLVTAWAWVEVGAVIHYGQKVNTTVAFAVFALAIGCLGNITTWKYFRQRKTEVLVFSPSKRAGK